MKRYKIRYSKGSWVVKYGGSVIGTFASYDDALNLVRTHNSVHMEKSL